jgi:hypothetical protein
MKLGNEYHHRDGIPLSMMESHVQEPIRKMAKKKKLVRFHLLTERIQRKYLVLERSGRLVLKIQLIILWLQL